MEPNVYVAEVIYDDPEVDLQLVVNSKTYSIRLTSDDLDALSKVFVALLGHLRSGLFCFELKEGKKDLFYFVAEEYIKQLNTELRAVYSELKESSLLIDKERQSVD